VLRGRLTGEQLEAAAELAERFGSGALRTTVSQNLLFIDIPNHKRGTGASWARSACMSKARPSGAAPSPAPAPSSASWPSLRPRASPAGWSMNSKSACPVRPAAPLHVTGCPNSCGQHWIADIGIEGKKIKHEGKLTDAYYFCLGGAVGQHAASRARSAIAAPRRWFPKRSSACCATTSPTGSLTKTCAPGSAATPTTSCAPISPAKFWRRRARSAHRPRAARRGE
jgi:hypothetical protein